MSALILGLAIAQFGALVSYPPSPVVFVEAICISSTEFAGDARSAQFKILRSSDPAIPNLAGSTIVLKYQEKPNLKDIWSGSRRIDDLVLERYSPNDIIYWWVRVSDARKPTQIIEPVLRRGSWFTLVKQPDILLRPIRTIARVKYDHEIIKYSDEVTSLGQAIMKVAALSSERSKQRELLRELEKDKCTAVAEWAKWVTAEYFTPRVAHSGAPTPQARQPAGSKPISKP